MTKKPEQIINEQVWTWSHQQAVMQRGAHRPKPWPVITISRECGAQGAALADVLAQRTGFTVWDKTLVHAVAEESGGDERIMATLDEHRQRSIEDAIFGTLSRTRHTNAHYVRSLMRVVHTIAAHGNGIIVGRGASFICTPRVALRVRVIGSFKQRVHAYAAREGLDERQAHRIVEQVDADRADFIRHTFRQDVADPAGYDLVVNSGTFGLEQLADIVLAAYEARAGRRLPERSRAPRRERGSLDVSQRTLHG